MTSRFAILAGLGLGFLFGFAAYDLGLSALWIAVAAAGGPLVAACVWLTVQLDRRFPRLNETQRWARRQCGTCGELARVSLPIVGAPKCAACRRQAFAVIDSGQAPVSLWAAGAGQVRPAVVDQRAPAGAMKSRNQRVRE